MAHEIDRLPQKQLVRMAKSMRNKARNEALDKARILNAFFGTLSAGGGGALTGHLVAMAQKKAAKLDPATLKKSDPRKPAGVDLEFWIALPLVGLGTFMQGKSRLRTAGSVVEGVGTGAFAAWTSKYAYDREMKKAT